MKFMFLIDKIIQQIVLQKDGNDPDPLAAIVNLDVKAMVAELNDTDRIQREDEKLRVQVEKCWRLEKLVDEMKNSGTKY